jgi:ribosomal protein S18 acetylase RimI-like enzyme
MLIVLLSMVVLVLMDFIKLDTTIHDITVASRLIYDTEPALFSLLFGKNKDHALSNIQKLIWAGNNSFGHDVIYLSMDTNNICGLTILYMKDDIDKQVESKRFSESLDLFSLIRLFFYEKTVIRRLLTTNHSKDELYISNICVDEQYRGQGVGRFILENIVEQAKMRDCKTIVLDVSTDNNIAVSLYKKYGFVIIKKRALRFFKTMVYQMARTI